MQYKIVPFTRTLSRTTFDCGYPELNEWLREQAGQQQKKNNTRTFLAHGFNDDRVAGFYAAAVGHVDVSSAARALGLGSGKYSVPIMLLARLAVSLSHQGKGLGRLLLVDALRSAVEISERAGLQAVVVDAIDSDAIRFYQRHGFVLFEDSKSRLYLPLEVIKATFIH